MLIKNNFTGRFRIIPKWYGNRIEVEYAFNHLDENLHIDFQVTRFVKANKFDIDKINGEVKYTTLINVDNFNKDKEICLVIPVYNYTFKLPDDCKVVLSLSNLKTNSVSFRANTIEYEGNRVNHYEYFYIKDRVVFVSNYLSRWYVIRMMQLLYLRFYPRFYLLTYLPYEPKEAL